MNEFIKAIRDISPIIWEATLKQQYIEGFIVFGIGVAVTIALSFGVYHTDNKKAAIVLIFGAYLLCVIIMAIGAVQLINPEYFAIQALKP